MQIFEKLMLSALGTPEMLEDLQYQVGENACLHRMLTGLA